MMDQQNKKGFTLIELLVVIAIISVLASIVLTSLGESRNKAKDAALRAELASLRSQAELYSSNNGNYGIDTGSCNAGMFANSDVQRIIIGLQAKAKEGISSVFCQSVITNWAVMVESPIPLGGYDRSSLCVSSGNSGILEGAGTAFTVENGICE